MKNMHDEGCAARQSQTCNCKTGEDRRIYRRAGARLKRQRRQIARRTGLHYDQTLIRVTKHGVAGRPDQIMIIEWHHDSVRGCEVGRPRWEAR